MQLCIHLEYFREREREAKKRVREEKKKIAFANVNNKALEREYQETTAMGYSYKDRNGFAIHIHSNYERKPLKMAAG